MAAKRTRYAFSPSRFLYNGIMLPDDLSPDLQTALKIGRQASQILLGYFKQRLDVTYKDDDQFSPVTRADEETDDFLRQAIARAFPGDQILTEENTLKPDSFKGRVWIIDPLDGTKDFVAGRDCFSINIGRLDDGVPSLGIIIVPARGWIFVAEKGKGAYELKDDRLVPAHVSKVHDIDRARLLTHSPSDEIRPLERLIFTLPFKSHIQEGGGTKQVLLASGRAEAQINTNLRASKWDVLAGEVIITEAGGTFSDLDGNPIDYAAPQSVLKQSYVAANGPDLHAKIIAAMKPWRRYLS